MDIHAYSGALVDYNNRLNANGLDFGDEETPVNPSIKSKLKAYSIGVCWHRGIKMMGTSLTDATLHKFRSRFPIEATDRAALRI